MRAPYLHSIAAALTLFATGCCCSIGDLVTLFEEHDTEPSPDEPGVELGVAVYPANATEANATRHAWREKRLDPSVYRVGYALSPAEDASVDSAQTELAKKLKYKSEGNGVFKWQPLPGCDKNMNCVYEDLKARSKPDLEPLVARFKARIGEAKLGTLDAAQLVVSFVQSIPYEIPEGRPFGLMPPALVVSRKKGDCDSKVLLGHILLEAIGVDSVMLNSDAHRHSMLGVALPAPGTKVTYKGRDYAFTEMTAKEAPIGWIKRDLLKPDDWIVVPVAVRDPASKLDKGDPVTGKAR
jgi:hypothetical protein